MEYNTNLLTLLNGHTGYDIGEEPKLPGKKVSTNKTELDTLANLRDSISALVASGYTSLKGEGGKSASDEIKAHVNNILYSMPQEEAQKLLTHIAVYNQNPNSVKLNPLQRLQDFYDINSSNPQTNYLLKRIKAFGSGPISGFKESPELLNQQIASSVAIK